MNIFVLILVVLPEKVGLAEVEEELDGDFGDQSVFEDRGIVLYV